MVEEISQTGEFSLENPFWLDEEENNGSKLILSFTSIIHVGIPTNA